MIESCRRLDASSALRSASSKKSSDALTRKTERSGCMREKKRGTEISKHGFEQNWLKLEAVLTGCSLAERTQATAKTTLYAERSAREGHRDQGRGRHPVVAAAEAEAEAEAAALLHAQHRLSKSSRSSGTQSLLLTANRIGLTTRAQVPNSVRRRGRHRDRHDKTRRRRRAAERLPVAPRSLPLDLHLAAEAAVAVAAAAAVAAASPEAESASSASRLRTRMRKKECK